jgi:hypothetical protein
MTPLTHLIVVPLLLALQCCVAPAVLCSPAPQRSEAPKDARAGRDAEHRGDKAAASSSSASSPPLWRHPLLWGSALFSAGYGARAFFHDGKHGAALRRMQAQLDSQQAQALQQQTERARMRLIHLMLADVYLKNCVLLRKLDLNTAVGALDRHLRHSIKRSLVFFSILFHFPIFAQSHLLSPVLLAAKMLARALSPAFREVIIEKVTIGVSPPLLHKLILSIRFFPLSLCPRRRLRRPRPTVWT